MKESTNIAYSFAKSFMIRNFLPTGSLSELASICIVQLAPFPRMGHRPDVPL